MRHLIWKWTTIAGIGAFLVFAIAFILDAVTGTVALPPTRSDSIRDGTFVPVVTWSGNEAMSTETFSISSMHWKISWNTVSSDYEPSEFQIYVYNANGSLRGMAADVTGTDTDSSFLRGGGNYYLVVQAEQHYHIQVEEMN